AHCETLCTIDVYRNGEDHIDSLGMTDAAERMRPVWEVEPSVTIMSGEPCATGTTSFVGSEEHYEEIITKYLNDRLKSFRLSVGVDGGYLNAKAVVREIAPGMADRITDSMVFVRYGDLTTRFELNSAGSGCELWYRADTLFCGTPEHPHPMVTHLNAVLDQAWGFKITGMDLFSYDWGCTTEWNNYGAQRFDEGFVPASYAALLEDAGEELFGCVNGGYQAQPMETWIDVSPPGRMYAFSLLTTIDPSW